MKNNAPKNGTSGINIQVPRRWFRIEEAQFRDLSATPIGTRDLDILIEDGKKNLSGEFDVHSDFAVNSHLLGSNREYANRVFTLEKRENNKDKTVSYWFVPINPGKNNKEYPAFVLQRVVLPELPKTSRLIARMKKTARNVLLPIGAAATIAWASVAVKEALEYREGKSGDRLKYTIVEDPTINEQPALEKPATDKEIMAEKPEQLPEVVGKIHVVQKWDTLEKIAEKYGVTLDKLFELNYFQSHIIHPGQEIVIEQWKRSETEPESTPQDNENLETFEQNIDTYIQRKTPDSPITGKMVISTSNKYGVLPEYLLAIMLNDSTLGTKWKWVRTRNPGNVGNDDEGNEREFKTWDEWVDAAGKNIRWRMDEFLKCYPDKKPLLSYLVKNIWPDGKGFLSSQKNYKVENPEAFWAYMTHKPGQEKVVQFALEARSRIY